MVGAEDKEISEILAQDSKGNITSNIHGIERFGDGSFRFLNHSQRVIFLLKYDPQVLHEDFDRLLNSPGMGGVLAQNDLDARFNPEIRKHVPDYDVSYPTMEDLYQAGVGLGDGLTFGGTKYLREWNFGFEPIDGGIDYDSMAYDAGEFIGNTTSSTVLSFGVGGVAGNLAAQSGNLNYVRFIPQTLVRNGLGLTGWTAGTMRSSSAARGGWSMVKGGGPKYRIQWTAPGGRHGGAEWKLSGNAWTIRKSRYFWSQNK